ncbi:MAG: transcription termination factor Rho [Eubacteriales bacterium]|nr:transcription termination factor Rho [Eubacteriales bacterium]
MREKYESLAVHDLKEIAKARGMKGISAMKKAEVVEAMLALDAKEAAAGNAQAAEAETAGEGGSEPAEADGEGGAGRQSGSVRDGKSGDEEGGQETERPRRTRRAPAGQVREGGSYDGGRQRERYSRSEGSSRYEGGRNDRSSRSEGSRSENNTGRYEGGRSENNTARSEGNRSENGGGRSEENGNQTQSRPAVGRYQERYNSPYNRGTTQAFSAEEDKFPAELDSGVTVKGILEVMPDGYGFIRSDNYLPGDSDVYVAPSQIRRFGLKTGDILEGNTRVRTQNEKFSALLYVKTINGYTTEEAGKRYNFEDMTPIFPNCRLKMEKYGSPVAMRIMDLLSPIGKGQRGMIVSPPKAGKTTLLKEVAQSVKSNYPDMHLIILLIDERPEEVTDMKETVEGPNVEVIYSTFDELPDHHKRVSEMVIERAKRLVEHRKDVIILLDSITRLTRAYNLVVPPSGRTLSGGIDPAALHMPKRFFGAARNMREGGSLTILATALVDTGSKMDDVIYEEFKGTGNMELVLDRKLSEKRLFPAIDIPKTSTRREDLLLTSDEMDAINIVRRALNGMKSDEAVDKILDLFAKTRTNSEFVQIVKKMRFI